ncbi:hypothetical protein [Algoriphagus sp. Y33]|nr:hypothetical protein [Algoriphagus sp. Y33]
MHKILRNTVSASRTALFTIPAVVEHTTRRRFAIAVMKRQKKGNK